MPTRPHSRQHVAENPSCRILSLQDSHFTPDYMSVAGTIDEKIFQRQLMKTELADAMQAQQGAEKARCASELFSDTEFRAIGETALFEVSSGYCRPACVPGASICSAIDGFCKSLKPAA